MPYISTEEVKQIRQKLKEVFPNIKFSVKREHYCSVHISIMKSHIDFFAEARSFDKERNYMQINHYSIASVFSGEQKDVLMKIYEIVKSFQNPNHFHEDGDYGTVPPFYIHINVGQWNKPYQLVAK